MSTNAGFSAGISYFGTISGLTPKSSSDGRSSSNAEAINEYGDTVANDVYGDLLNPTTEYAVTDDITSATLCTLGAVVSSGSGSSATSIMITSCTINTSAKEPPTVTISGVQVESGATAARTYPVTITSLKARSKAQDVMGAFATSPKFTQITTTFSVDPHVATVAGNPVASDASHGRVEVSATMTDGDGTGSITLGSGTGWTITSTPAKNAPDQDYVTLTATATKYITGTEGSSSNSSGD